MQKYELSINLFNREVTVFLQPGFFGNLPVSVNPHSHRSTEIHCVQSGQVQIYIDGKTHTAKAGEIIVIPKGRYHYYTSYTSDARTLPFQTNIDIDIVQTISVMEGFLNSFAQEVEKFTRNGHKKRLAAYITFLCCLIADEDDIKVSEITNREFLVHEFLASNYCMDITLADLAKVLNSSEKQAARYVQKYTGNTFRSELSTRRIKAATQIMGFEKISLAQASTRVGYKSYSGFWKAYNSQKTTALDKTTVR